MGMLTEVFPCKMSGFDRLLTKAASVMSQKMADLVLVLWQSLRESVFGGFECCTGLY